MGQVSQDAISLRGVSKIYGSGETRVPAVTDVDLSVRMGEIVLVMGPSGSGKTTLLLLAGGLLTPTSGTVLVEGRDISRLRGNELSLLRRQRIGFVFQSFNLLSALSAIENVEVVLNLAGLKGRQAHDQAVQLLGEFGLGARTGFLPAQLSGGEKQRVSIARALANDPPVLLADEPTANLDSQRGHEVMHLLKEVSRKRRKSVIIVSHDQRIKDVADRIVWMEDGRLRDMGSVAHDPVCGMALEEYNAAASTVYGGRKYYFCAAGCKKIFDSDPLKYSRVDK